MRHILSKSDCFFLLILVSGLVIISRFNYLLFHSLVEIAIATTGFLAFAFTWHLRRFELGTLLAIGTILGCSAFISVFHMLAFKGMGVFHNDANLATQLWIATRYLFSTVTLFSFYFRNHKIDPTVFLVSVCGLTLALLALVFSGHFPECFNPEKGQTEFKILSEYVISFLLMLSMGLFWTTRKSYSANVTWLIMAFFIFSIMTELVFTSYLNIYDLSNMLGHLFHLVASYFLYKAIVETGLVSPFDLMFRNLNEAVRARDEFISLASHELKTPLTPLKLQIQMFQREMQKAVLNEALQMRILKSIQSSNQQLDRLNKLIDSMLDVSRLSTRRFEIYPELTELSGLIRDVARRHEAQVLAAGSILELKLAPVKLSLDPIRVEQVITNLLMNALKYAPGSPIEIGLEVKVNGVEIWVSDQGPGISKEFQERIFKRYERGLSESSVGGLGLGLYISQQIVEAHGGTIILENNAENGARFTINFPK